MNKIRIGKDFAVKWPIYSKDNGDRKPYIISNAELRLITPIGVELTTEYKFNENVVEWIFRGKDQKYIGIYSLELVKNDGQNGMVTVDVCKAFELVAHSCEENINASGDVTIETIYLESDIMLAPIAGGESYDDTEIREELAKKADKADIPTKVSELENDAEYVTPESFKTINGESIVGEGNIVIEGGGSYDDTAVKVELVRLEKDKADKADIPTKVSELENDAEYVTETQAMRDYQPKGDYTTPESFKSINGEPIVGEGNIVIEGGGESYDDTEIRAELSRLDAVKAEKAELTELSSQVGTLSEEMENKQDVYVAKYGVTTREQIKAAWEANKHIVCVYGNKLFNLTNYGDEYDIYFACVYYSVELLTLSVAGNWSRKTIAFESPSNKTTTITSSSTDTQYSSAKAVYDFVQSAVTNELNADF